ncbi:hypothetical protein [Nocardioides sp.]|uniref:hypothetical protein n=1 Tax=Nocardioides sp. TaxID=35761 RepID=UPI0037835390
MEPTAPVVLAALDDEVGAALAFALDEARRHHCPLRVVAYEDDVLQRVLARVGEVPAEGRLVSGTPVRAVLDASADARLVVVRRRDLLHLFRALTDPDDVLPTTWADPPVACVPPVWSPRPDDDRPITVGVEDAATAGPLLERALEACGEGPLRTVHAAHQRAGVVLLHEATRSRVLVLGRNPADDRGGTRLGRTARWVLHEAACPVVVLPPSGTPEPDRSPGRVHLEGCGQRGVPQLGSR